MLCCSLSSNFFSKLTFRKILRNTIRASNGLNPDQDRRYVGSNNVTNCLQRLWVNDSDRNERVYGYIMLTSVLHEIF